MSEGPLAGRTVVVTRATDQASRLAARLRACGATVVELPATDVVDLPGAFDEVDVPGAYEWIVVTSPNGAARLARALDGRSARPAQVAAVGPGTVDALAAAGIECDLVAHDAIAEGLVDAFPAPSRRDAPVLVAQAAAARPVVVDGLRAKGWDVTAIATHETVPRAADPSGAAKLRAADAIVFAAGSAVRAIVGTYGAGALPPTVVCMGPVTAAEVRAAGSVVAAIAEPHTFDGLVAATVAALGGDA